MARKKQSERLRKQPKPRRMYTTATINMPRVDVPDTAQRRRRRKKTQPMRTGLALLRHIVWNARWVSLGLLALTVYALFLTWQSDRFYLTYIPVEGAVSVPPEEVVARSGLAGHHVFAADPVQAAASIATLPGVISSTVTLNWPNQVYIRIREEQPVAVWREAGVDYWVTKSGRLLPARQQEESLLQIVSEMAPVAETAAAATEADANATADAAATVTPAPTATAVPPTPTPPGADAGPRATILGADGEIVSAPPPNETAEEELPASVDFVPEDVLEGALQLQRLRPNIQQLYYRPYGGLSYEDGRGWRAYFGTGTDMHQKLVMYETIVDYLLSRGITPTVVSVSNQEKPYYRVPVVEQPEEE